MGFCGNFFKKKELEKLIKENVYNKELQDTYVREVLDEDKEFDDDFDIVSFAGLHDNKIKIDKLNNLFFILINNQSICQYITKLNILQF